MTPSELTIAVILILILILLPIVCYLTYSFKKQSKANIPTSAPELEMKPAEKVSASAHTTIIPSSEFFPASGEKIGKYTVVEVIGSGGMGKIIKAVSPEKRPVAIKIMKPEHSNNKALVSRFQRELKIASMLNHENIAKILDWEMGRGHYFFVMEYVDGVSLRYLLKKEKIDVSRTVDIIKQVCNGLWYAHAKNVVHRDVKPENILIEKNGCVKIVDFGIARLNEAENPASPLTMTNVSMGSPLYMSPEQKNDFKHVDHRADIYSLGVIFYEMLSGELPGSLLRIDLIPAGLRRIIQKSTSYYAGDRYLSIKDMLDDIKSYETAGEMSQDQNALEQIGENERLRQVSINVLYPKELPEYKGLDIASLYLAASGVGGNYYDFIKISESCLGILVGNVFEKPDVRSAIFLAMVRSAFRIFSMEEKDPGNVFGKLNNFISREKFDLFAVFSYLICDTSLKTLRLSTAGYRPVGVLGKTGNSFKYIQSEGIGIGITENSVFQNVDVKLESGDIIIMSSAGAPETKNLAGEVYGQERFDNMIVQNREKSAAQIAEAVRKNLAYFSVGVALQDDITVVVIKVNYTQLG